MLKILIVDDETAAGNILKLLIERFISVEKEICICDSPQKALELLPHFKPTLVMLDIEMPNMSGFDFLNQAATGNFDVIFTTAFDQYAIKAIRFSALDYLLKPIDRLELQSAINRHITKHKNTQPNQQLLVNNLISNLQLNASDDFKLALSTQEGVSFYTPSSIMYCEGEINYTRFYFVDQKPQLISKTLGEYEELLEGHQFIRIHKSYLVNKKYVRKIDREGMVIMSDGKLLPISRRRKEMVLNMMSNG